MISDKSIKDDITRLLRGWGFQVTPIEERQSTRTPDLFVSYQSEHYLIEIKTKTEDEQIKQKENQLLLKGDLVSRVDPINRRNRMSDIIEDAVAQLTQYESEGNTFRLIWFHSDGPDAELWGNQFEYTLYGKKDVFSLDGKIKLCPCYFFGFNDFYRFKDLDGAVITANNGCKFCLNTFSSNINQLRKSFLAQCLKPAIVDPEAEEKQGNALIVDCDIDRREESRILLYIQEKYKNNKINVMKFKQQSAQMLLPRSP